MGLELFHIERHGDGTATIEIRRPEKLNAMNPQFFRELIASIELCDSEPDVVAVVLTGSGRSFSTGGDHVTFRDLADVPAYRAHLRLVFDAFSSLERARAIVIGAVNGFAFGGGTELTLACDLAIASEEAQFAFVEVTVGLTPGWGVIRGPDVMGRPWTKWLALTGDVVDADQAVRMGLVQEVVPHAELLPRALGLARRIAANPPLAVAVGKQLVNRGTSEGFRESLEATALLLGTDEHKQAVHAFLARRDGTR